VVARVLHAPLPLVACGFMCRRRQNPRMGGFRAVSPIHTPCVNDDSPCAFKKEKHTSSWFYFPSFLFYFFFYSIFSLICFNQLEQLLAVKRKG
jgi:hypothetical protein